MKNSLAKIIILFITFIITVFTTVFLLCIEIDVIWKVLALVLGIGLSIFEFIIMQPSNKNTSKEAIAIDKKIDNTPIQGSSKHQLCPKCYKPFDGEVCFYCGFEKNSFAE